MYSKVNERKMSNKQIALNYRQKFRGLIGVKSKLPVKDSDALSLLYTPGVGEVCLEIQDKLDNSYDYTCRSNTIALISDGSSFPGLGNIGSFAILPLLENRSVLHKTFAGIDAFPLSINTQDVNEIIKLITLIKDSFAGFQIENIASPKCFEIERELKESLNMPFLCNDREGSGVSILAAIINSSKLIHKELKDLQVVISNIDVAGIKTARLLVKAGIKNIILCDSKGAIYEGRLEEMTRIKDEIAQITNPEKRKGSLNNIIKGTDVFINFSALNSITSELIKDMATDPVIISLSSPGYEISYNQTILAGATIIATSKPNAPNHINVTIPTPGIFRGTLDIRAQKINDTMLVAAAYAMANLVEDDNLSFEHILPRVLDFRVAPKIASAVAKAGIDTGVATVKIDPEEIERKTLEYLYEGEYMWIDPPSISELEEKTSLGDKSVLMHKRHHGVIQIKAKVPIKDNYIYKLLYEDSAVSEPCDLIQKEPKKVYDLTCKNNMVAVVTNGTAVLGLGNIGSIAGLPVMEGKSVLFKLLGGVEAFPICINSNNTDEIVWVTTQISSVFGGINLEDIAAPACFEIEDKLKKSTDIIIFHDDQHGTAVVTLAGLINALKLTSKDKDKIKVVMNGAGAGALAVAELLLAYGIKNIIICDTKGAIYKNRPIGMNPYKEQIAEFTNLDGIEGKLADVLKGADVFIGLSVGNVLTKEMIKSMNTEPIIFALANPYPEIMPKDAYEAGAKIVATGRSDLPNQVNNSIAFPGIFRGALDVRAKAITRDMKLAAAVALASLVKPEELTSENILPKGLDLRAPVAVAEAVAKSAINTGVARVTVSPEKIKQNLQEHLNEYIELRTLAN